MSDVGSDARAINSDNSEFIIPEADRDFLGKQYDTQSAVFDTTHPAQSSADALVVEASQAEVVKANAVESARFNHNQRTPARSLYMRGGGKKSSSARSKKGKSKGNKSVKKSPAKKRAASKASKKKSPAKKKKGAAGKRKPAKSRSKSRPKPKPRK